MQPQARPIGVTILAVIAILGGIASVAVGVMLISLSSAIATATTTTLTGFQAGLFGGLGVVSGIVELAFGISIFLRAGWAWRFGIGTYVFNLLYYIATLIVESAHKSTSASIIANVVSGIISIAILAYLNTAPVKHYFGQS